MTRRILRPPRSEAARETRRPITLSWRAPSIEPSLRNSGITLLGRVPWGTHICLFYEAKQDLLDSALAFFSPAASANEYCAWFVWEPLTEQEARDALDAAQIPQRLGERAAFEILRADNWHLRNGRFDMRAAVDDLHCRVSRALATGFHGVRICANPHWREVNLWRDINEFEHALDAMIAKQHMIALCAYEMAQSPSDDVLDVANTHQCVIARRRATWEFLEMPDMATASQEIAALNSDLSLLPDALRTGGSLTERELVVLGQIVKGASSKQAARTLGISPRTVEYHRANIMQKLGARNVVELVRKVLGAGRAVSV